MHLKQIARVMLTVFAAVLTFSCIETDEPVKPADPDTLSIDPVVKMIQFKATDNEDVILQVKTNVEKFICDAPEWIIVNQNESTLTINATNNDTPSNRVGRITISAGTAKAIKINVEQSAEEVTDDPSEITGPKATLIADTKVKYAFDKEGKVTIKVKMSIEKTASSDVKAKLILDPGYLQDYQTITGNNRITLLPEANVMMDDNLLVIKSGSLESNEVSIDCTMPAGLEYGFEKLVSIIAKPVANVSFTNSGKRANFVLWRHTQKPIRNVVYFEVNDVNPLNALECNLEDGTPFFDAVILFAANINWDSTNKRVYLNCNPNVQALLDESDVYLQPLRKKGIKVYLGLLGNHDAAGLCNLSDWGAQQWAKEVAAACKEYKLDGVNLDDEYTSGSMHNKWFTKTSAQAGSRLCYELKQALKKECEWPTEVSYYTLGALWACTDVTDQETGVVHHPGEFIDFYVGDYGQSTGPYADIDYDKCCGMSVELNRGIGGVSEDYAKECIKKGYGWIMWFAYNPAPGSNAYNGTGSINLFKRAARGEYNQEMLTPTHYYEKLGGGRFSPERIPFK